MRLTFYSILLSAAVFGLIAGFALDAAMKGHAWSVLIQCVLAALNFGMGYLNARELLAKIDSYGP